MASSCRLNFKFFWGGWTWSCGLKGHASQHMDDFERMLLENNVQINEHCRLLLLGAGNWCTYEKQCAPIAKPDCQQQCRSFSDLLHGCVFGVHQFTPPQMLMNVQVKCLDVTLMLCVRTLWALTHVTVAPDMKEMEHPAPVSFSSVDATRMVLCEHTVSTHRSIRITLIPRLSRHRSYVHCGLPGTRWPSLSDNISTLSVPFCVDSHAILCHYLWPFLIKMHMIRSYWHVGITGRARSRTARKNEA